MGGSTVSGKAITETAAARQDEALAVVQRLLRERGIQTRRQQRISLGLFAGTEGPALLDRPPPRSWLNWYPPELVVTGSRGWREATVTVGEREGDYLLSLRNGQGQQKVGQAEPEKVAGLITEALRAAR